MREVIILKGLPGSGKSTWAKDLMRKHPNQYKRINKDLLREMLDFSEHSKAREDHVLHMRDNLLMANIVREQSVIIDDTNLHPKHEHDIRGIVANWNEKNPEKKFTVKVVEMDTPLDECIRRDAERTDHKVGEKPIRDMYNKYLVKLKAPEVIPGAPITIICDLDGTIALLNGRNPYDASTCEQDLVNGAVASTIDAYRAYIKSRLKVIMVSGRMSTYMEETKRWLDKNNIDWDDLLMRKEGDTRQDQEVKKELYEQHILGKHNVLFVMDDRQRVVDMWRDNGLTVFQVAPGDF